MVFHLGLARFQSHDVQPFLPGKTLTFIFTSFGILLEKIMLTQSLQGFVPHRYAFSLLVVIRIQCQSQVLITPLSLLQVPPSVYHSLCVRAKSLGSEAIAHNLLWDYFFYDHGLTTPPWSFLSKLHPPLDNHNFYQEKYLHSYLTF